MVPVREPFVLDRGKLLLPLRLDRVVCLIQRGWNGKTAQTDGKGKGSGEKGWGGVGEKGMRKSEGGRDAGNAAHRAGGGLVLTTLWAKGTYGLN